MTGPGGGAGPGAGVGAGAGGEAGHRTAPHTADLILQAWGPTFQECLGQLVAALSGSYAETSGAPVSRRHEFRFVSADDERTVVALLEEALYVLDVLGAVAVGTHLEPSVGHTVSGWFELVDVEHVELVGSVPKGVARSGLTVDRSDGQWRCTVMIDV